MFVDKIFFKQIIHDYSFLRDLSHCTYACFTKGNLGMCVCLGSENKVIDLDLPIIMLVTLENSVYSPPESYFLKSENGDNKTDLCILPSQDYCRESNEFT